MNIGIRFPCSYTEYLGMVGSDHRTVVGHLDNKVTRRRGQFRFDKIWIGQDGLLDSIERGWGEFSDENPGDFVSKLLTAVMRSLHGKRIITLWKREDHGTQKST